MPLPATLAGAAGVLISIVTMVISPGTAVEMVVAVPAGLLLLIALVHDWRRRLQGERDWEREIPDYVLRQISRKCSAATVQGLQALKEAAPDQTLRFQHLHQMMGRAPLQALPDPMPSGFKPLTVQEIHDLEAALCSWRKDTPGPARTGEFTPVPGLNVKMKLDLVIGNAMVPAAIVAGWMKQGHGLIVQVIAFSDPGVRLHQLAIVIDELANGINAVLEAELPPEPGYNVDAIILCPTASAGLAEEAQASVQTGHMVHVRPVEEYSTFVATAYYPGFASEIPVVIAAALATALTSVLAGNNMDPADQSSILPLLASDIDKLAAGGSEMDMSRWS